MKFRLINSKAAEIKASPLPLTGFCLSALAIVMPAALACGPPPAPRAQTFVGAMNRAQTAYFLDKNTFTNSVSELGLTSSGPPYTYSIQRKDNAVYNLGISGNRNEVSYVGAVFIVPASNLDKRADRNEMTTISILCRSNSAGAIRTLPSYKNGTAVCGTGSQSVYRSR